MTEIDDKLCPLCQQNNSCGVKSATPCWCLSQEVPTALIKQVPPSLKNKACICQKCIEKFAEHRYSANFYDATKPRVKR